MTLANRSYLPAAGLNLLLPLYDPLVKLLGADRARKKLFEQAAVLPHHRVLDIGCGTGTFAVAIKRWSPSVEVVGLDPDPKALARSRHKDFEPEGPHSHNPLACWIHSGERMRDSSARSST